MELDEWRIRGLELLWLELTGRCNLECLHCYADSGPKRPAYEGMRLEDWKGVLREASELGCKSVQFIGGEPALYPDLCELIRYARVRGHRFVQLYTNGTILSEKLRSVLRAYRVAWMTSVYGQTAPVHDAITRCAGSFDRTVDGIRWALEAGLSVEVSVIEMIPNRDTVAATREFFAAMGVPQVGIHRVRGVGRGRDVAVIGETKSGWDELCGNCWKGRLCVTASGDIFPCVFARSWRVGKVSDGLRSVLAGNRLTDFRLALVDELQRRRDAESS